LRFLRAAGASLGLAALQVLAKRRGKAGLLLVLGCLAGHGISSASVLYAGTRRIRGGYR
jgi:hypothetical protein